MEPNILVEDQKFGSKPVYECFFVSLDKNLVSIRTFSIFPK